MWRIKCDGDVVGETPYMPNVSDVIRFPDGRGPYKIIKINPWDYVYDVEKVSEK